jgi:hypothetical protein
MSRGGKKGKKCCIGGKNCDGIKLEKILNVMINKRYQTTSSGASNAYTMLPPKRSSYILGKGSLNNTQQMSVAI